MEYTFSPKFKRYTYELKGVPKRSGIRIHSGNYAFKFIGKPDIEGCILLGTSYNDINKDGVNDIINSKKTIEEFEKILDKKPTVLVIK